MFYVYAHFKPNCLSPFYIGKGKGYRSKCKQHRNTYWHNIVNKYGYEIKILKNNLSEDEAFKMEIEQIAYWKDLGHCEANLTLGGEGVSGLTGHPAWNKGKTWSKEVKEKLSKAKLNKPSPKRKIVIDVSTGIEYSCSYSAAKAIGLSQAALSRKLSGKRKNDTTLIYKEN